jgi:hypothetical protein
LLTVFNAATFVPLRSVSGISARCSKSVPRQFMWGLWWTNLH